VTLSPFFIDKKEATLKEVINFLNDMKDREGFQPYPGSLHYQGDYFWGAGWDTSEQSISPVIFDGTQFVFNGAAAGECPNQGGIEAAAGGFSWLGAKMFCEWKGMQLPTEAQWEAAARGQTFNEFPCGSDLAECWWGVYACCSESEICGGPYANLCHCCAPFSSDNAETCLSPFGLIGMYGNANEWTLDYVDNGHQECVGGCVDPEPEATATTTTAHLLKGGSMASDQSGLRISSRSADSIYVDDGTAWTGVRCVRPDEPFVQPDAGAGDGR
jgi:formylglycine-generating enzyme required for sulfatase activity